MSDQGNPYSTRFFGGVEEVRRIMAESVLKALPEDKFDYFNALCGFTPDNIQMPTCQIVKADPQRITSRFFSMVAHPLKLTLNKVLPLNDERLDPDFLESVKESMAGNCAGPVAGFPAVKQSVNTKLRSQEETPSDAEAKLYILFRITDEIDEALLASHPLND